MPVADKLRSLYRSLSLSKVISNKMQYKKLGNSDLNVSIVCLGTMTWGGQNTEEQAYEQLDYALEKGINFLDTAELYAVPPREEIAGLTEEYIGRWMKLRNVPRDKLIIATKVASAGFPRDFVARNRTVPKGPPGESCRLTGPQIRAALQGSLRRLQTDYIDLYQLHWPDRYVPVYALGMYCRARAGQDVMHVLQRRFGFNQYDPAKERDAIAFEEQLETVAALIKEGKIRHWGLSNETTFGVCKFCELAARLGLPPPVSIQNDFSLLDRRFEGDLAEACAPTNYNIGLLPYGPLAGGSLSGKYLNGGNPAGSRNQLYPWFQPRYFSPLALAAVEKYAALAKAKGMTPTQLALAWCKSRWYVASTIIGATTMSQLEENIAAFDIDLDAETLKMIDEIHRQHRNPNVQD